MSSKWMCQQSLRCGSRRRVRTGIGAFKRGRQGAATRIGRARYWSSGPFQSVKSYTAHHRCSVCPHALQSKRPLATTGRLIWIALWSAPQNKQLKKTRIGHRSPVEVHPVRWANWVAIVKRAVCILAVQAKYLWVRANEGPWSRCGAVGPGCSECT